MKRPKTTDQRPKTIRLRRMKYYLPKARSLVCGLWSLVLFSLSASAQVVSVREVLSNPDKFDNQTIEIQGEVIGEPIQGGGGVWFNILEYETNAGIFVSDKGDIAALEYWGSYRKEGDWVKIKGVFYSQCPVHHVQDIHLTALRVLEPGYIVEDVIAPYKVKSAAVFFIICLTTAVIYFIKVFYIRRKSI